MTKRVLFLALLFCSIAAAQGTPTDEDRKQAKAHFRQGAAFYSIHDYEDALREYQSAYALLPIPELVFNIAQAHLALGHKELALRHYQQYLRESPNVPARAEALTQVESLNQLLADASDSKLRN